MATAKKRGDKYRVRVYTGTDKEGKKIYRSVTANTKREAERLATQIRIDYDFREDITFGEAIRRYIDVKSNVLSPSTLSGYEDIRRNYTASISQIRLSRITNEDLQRQINEIALNHSPKTVANANGLFSSVIKMFNPSFVMDIRVPAKIRKEKLIPSDDEIEKLMKQSEGTTEQIAYMLAAFGSLRRGEIAAIYPDCIFEDHITVKRAYVQDKDNNWVLKEQPKSYAGYRDVPLPGEIMERLQSLIAGQIPGKDEFGVIGLSPNAIYRCFKRDLRRAKLASYRLHDLRHYFASWMHEEGIPDKTIAKIGGWEDIATLQKIYQHSTMASEEVAAQKITEKFQRMNKKK